MTASTLQCLPSAGEAARRLAARLGLSLYEIEAHCFPDQELRVTVGEAAATTLVHASLHQPNEKLLTLLFATEALRRGGARRLVLIAPYLCYMRQDAVFHDGEAISQKVVGKLLAQAFDRVVTVNAHLHRTANIGDVFPGIDASDLSAMPAVADALRAGKLDSHTVVVGPDEESRPLVSNLAALLSIEHEVAHKSRRGDRSVEIAFDEPARLANRPVLLIDDVVSSGATLAACARVLRAAGAKTIDAVVVHALFAPELLRDLFDAGIRSVRSTDSVPHPTNAIALETILADTLRMELAT